MKDQVLSINSLLQEQYEDLEPKVRKLFPTPEIFNFQKIILTGAGDSYAAALVGKFYLERFAGLQTEVVSAIDLSRNYQKETLYFSPQNPLVIAISNSGNVARIGEALARTKNWGAYNVAITANIDSAVGKQCERHLVTEIPKMASSPGVRSYLVNVLALILLAIRLGEVKGKITMDQASELRENLHNLSCDLLTIEKTIDRLTPTWAQYTGYDFIGDGSDFGNVLYGSAKILEAAGKYSMYVNTEEWLHLNFFLRKHQTTGTILFINQQNAGFSREKEVLEYIEKLERPALVITDTDLTIRNEKITIIKFEKNIFHPLLQWVPAAFLASNIAVEIGEEDGRGTKGPWAFARNGAAVQKSKIVKIE
ncbi:MAG: SIS domain-containing protein [Enterococcaceae bacterium]|jgi:glucosamine--fructose-6-phosphate aminotransferase (isomerizing)|nr:SIS domain-containing protein [Enterococcaceae bacterium]MCI1919071.1 SIS domain-containing protein [Enterococcaceae bacterium]